MFRNESGLKSKHLTPFHGLYLTSKVMDMLPEVHNTGSLHLGNVVANMSSASNLFLDCLFCALLRIPLRDQIKTPSIDNSLCFNLVEFAIRLYKWKPFLALSGLLVVTLTDVLLLWYS